MREEYNMNDFISYSWNIDYDKLMVSKPEPELEEPELEETDWKTVDDMNEWLNSL